jgi:Leucine-rich repeat (LRR) protein
MFVTRCNNSSNALTGIDSGLTSAAMSKLRVLIIRGNSIKHLPHTLAQLSSLTELDISDNALTEMTNVEALHKLRTLHCSWNRYLHHAVMTL